MSFSCGQFESKYSIVPVFKGSKISKSKKPLRVGGPCTATFAFCRFEFRLYLKNSKIKNLEN